jgi:hypothetical protein
MDSVLMEIDVSLLIWKIDCKIYYFKLLKNRNSSHTKPTNVFSYKKYIDLLINEEEIDKIINKYNMYRPIPRLSIFESIYNNKNDTLSCPLLEEMKKIKSNIELPYINENINSNVNNRARLISC